MSCADQYLCEIKQELIQIRQLLYQQTVDKTDGWQYTSNREWQYNKVGKNYVYAKKVTLTGTTQTIELQLDKGIKLNRIETFSNDTTLKTFDIRVYTGLFDGYAILDAIVADQNQSVIFFYGTDDYIFPYINKLTIVITTSTLNKTLEINVQLTEL